MPGLLKSCLCTQAQVESPTFRQWCEPLREPPTSLHRKVWEYCFIAQALNERGLLQPGRRGLGFAVGKEPLVALFASRGCEIVATDMDEERAREIGWTKTNQHTTSLDVLNGRGICPPDIFRRRVTMRVADMNHIPDDLRDFDFVWSACSFEHLGSIELGKRFIDNMMKCLKPGGVAVHTTEFNLSSNQATLDNDWTVLFRKRDIQEIARNLRSRGHGIEVDFDPGSQMADKYIDLPPYIYSPHLKLKIAKYTATSIGLIIEKGAPTAIERPSPLLDRIRAWCGHLGVGREHAQRV